MKGFPEVGTSITDTDAMRLAVAQARLSKSEGGVARPLVGAVAVKGGELLGYAHRGELGGGNHAEFTLLEKKLATATLAGATVFTTLEPCTKRGGEKTPCADRLVERRVSRVVIGTLDPNPDIRGQGQLRLRQGGVATDLFTDDLAAEIEELNRDFFRYHRGDETSRQELAQIETRANTRSLDDWYWTLVTIYWSRNFYRDPAALFAHLVEVVGSLSLLASEKRKPGVRPEEFVSKAIAWWMALCGKMGVASVMDLLWDKFPAVCPYCRRPRHEPRECLVAKRASPGPQWEELSRIGDSKKSSRPSTLAEWQRMFADIYQPGNEGFAQPFGRLTEELGELAEAVRVFPAEPGYFLSEAADVFAWLMNVQNLLEFRAEVPVSKYGMKLQANLARAYPDACRDCGKPVCACPPILASTIGRIAHEVPGGRGAYGDSGRFLTPEKVRGLLRLG